MKVVVSSEVVLSRVPEGPIAPYLGRFADLLNATGYTAWWIHRQVLLGACFSQWLGQKAVALQDITSDHLTRYCIIEKRFWYVRIVLRSMPVTRSISRWLAPASSKVQMVVCRCGFKTFTSVALS